MILSIVYHQDCVISPVNVNAIQVISQLYQKEWKGITICFTIIDSIEEFIVITYSSNDIEVFNSKGFCLLVMFTFKKPTTLTCFSCSEYTLINADNPHAWCQGFNILCSSILPLELSIWVIVTTTYLSYLPICDIQLWFHEPNKRLLSDRWLTMVPDFS